MTTQLKDCLCKNFLAAIDMFTNVVRLCPDELWKDKKFFNLTYHTAIFLEYYLSSPVKDFRPILTYTLYAADKLPIDAVDDVIADRHFTKNEVIRQLLTVREKCQSLISQATMDKLLARWIHDEEVDLHGLCPSVVVNYSLLEILMYNLRHLQHHTGQLNLFMRQQANVATDWISHADCV